MILTVDDLPESRKIRPESRVILPAFVSLAIFRRPASWRGKSAGEQSDSTLSCIANWTL